jgi:hypothetical protein
VIAERLVRDAARDLRGIRIVLFKGLQTNLVLFSHVLSDPPLNGEEFHELFR